MLSLYKNKSEQWAVKAMFGFVFSGDNWVRTSDLLLVEQAFSLHSENYLNKKKWSIGGSNP